MLLTFISLVIVSCISCNKSDTILIENFEAGNYAEWTETGTAFKNGPSGGEDSHQMVASLGTGFASSVNPENEPATGTLTLPQFMIEHNTIHFLLGAHEIHFLPNTEFDPEKLTIQLLIENKVVRSKTPDEFHAMFRRAWDVSEFKEKEAQIRIVDNDDRMWAHIDVDEIVHNNIPVDGKKIERELWISKPILNFPVKEGAERSYLEIFTDGKQIRGMDVELATDDIDYWVVTDLGPWMGKEIQLSTRLFAENYPKLLDKLTFADQILDSKDLYQEKLRPQFHFSSKRGWINDPNGLVYYDGEYHLFYQHNPYGWDHSRNDYNKTWGHAVSTDLVHWKEMAGAIHPDHLGPIYSGSSVVDHKNTTGFQTGDEKPIVCIYTSAGGRSPWSVGRKFTQSIAYSNDRGRTFTIYEKNPVQVNLDHINRDPKVIWHEPSNQWIIVLHFDERAMAFFTSDDLKTWEKQSEFENPYLIDCPELFELPVDGDKKNKKWVIYGGSGAYHIGDFDGKKFIPETKLIQYNFGNAFYASQTFSNTPEERRVQIAWALIPTPGMPFNMSMLFPVELTLRTTDDGIRMFALPVKEIKNIYSKKHTWNDFKLEPGQIILSDIKGELFDIDIEFELGEAESFGFVIHDMSISFNSNENLLSCGEEEADLRPVEGKIKMRILVDRLSVEIFANEGRVYMPMRNNSYIEKSKNILSVFTKGADLNIKSLVVKELSCIWK
jgi:fructan beta-fructosidase